MVTAVNWRDRPEPEVVAAAVAGDREAFGELYTRCRGLVYWAAAKRGCDKELADDLTSEAFARALRRIDSYKDQGRDFAAYVCTIVRNLASDHWGSAKVRYRSNLDLGEAPEAVDEDVAGSPERALVRAETVAAVRAAVDGLRSKNQSKAVRGRYLEGRSLAQVAAELGVSEMSVKCLALRGSAQLAKALREFR